MQWNRSIRSRTARAGFTMVEILVVIAIILVLMTLSLGAAMKVMDSVNRSNTERTMQKVQVRLDQRLKSLNQVADDWTTPQWLTDAFPGCTSDQYRVLKVKVLTLFTLPATYAQVQTNCGIAPAEYPVPNMIQNRLTNYAGGSFPSSTNIEAQRGACLAAIYEVCGGSLDDFSAAELRDTDGDGVREIVDAWGHPLQFFHSGIQGSGTTPTAPTYLERGAQNAYESLNNVDPADLSGQMLDSNWLTTHDTNYRSTFGLRTNATWLNAPYVIVSMGRNGVLGGFNGTSPDTLSPHDDLDTYRARIAVTGQ
jgi:prepilin-type N-terminal cleavage/methylation domain-containing protein